nr:hypothetical protein [Paraburkholderia sp. J94]
MRSPRFDALPFPAQACDFGFDRLREARHFTLAEREALAQRQRSERAIEVEHTRALRTLDMNMRGPVIVRKDHDAGAGYAKQCGHGSTLT